MAVSGLGRDNSQEDLWLVKAKVVAETTEVATEIIFLVAYRKLNLS